MLEKLKLSMGAMVDEKPIPSIHNLEKRYDYDFSVNSNFSMQDIKLPLSELKAPEHYSYNLSIARKIRYVTPGSRCY